MNERQQPTYQRVSGDPLNWVRIRLGHRSATTTLPAVPKSLAAGSHELRVPDPASRAFREAGPTNDDLAVLVGVRSGVGRP